MKKALCTTTLALLLTVVVSACAGTASPTTIAPATTAKPPPTTSAPASAPPPTTTKPEATTPAGQAPKYGGTLNLVLTADITTFDDANRGGPGAVPGTIIAQTLWAGDWTKGNAGGYGTNVSDWGSPNPDSFSTMTGSLAQSWSVNVNNDQGTGTIVYEIRPGVHFALDPNSPASKSVNGREVTVADILAAIKQATTDPKAFIYGSNPELRTITPKQTGPMEITVTVPIDSLVSALSRLGSTVRIYPAEVRDTAGTYPTTDWKNEVGPGPFMLTGYTSGSSLTFTKNPNFWMTDPTGPGKGNRLPYIDGVQFFILPDASTRLAAFRTGKIDQINGLAWEDSAQLKKEFPQMPSAAIGDYYSPGGSEMYMRTDKAPYNDVRVRRALMMATDFQSILKSWDGGNGIIITYPFAEYADLQGLYVNLTDPDVTDAIKQQFVYNPDGAKQLLAQAGFPAGFTTSVLCTAAQSSYNELIASMWAKAGITLNIKVQDATVITNTLNAQALTDLTTNGGYPATAIYYTGNIMNGVGSATNNMSYVNDPVIQDLLPKVRILAATDPPKSLLLARQMTLRALDQAWVVQIPKYRTITFWQPWLKNYTGELSVGHYLGSNWAQYIWLDQALKSSSGH